MSFENKPETQEESTIFTASPIRKEEKKTDGKKKRKTAIIAAALALIITGGTVFGVSLIPEKPDDTSSSQENPTVTALTNSQVKYVEFLKGSEKTVFLAKKNETDSSESAKTTWSIKGIDKALTESALIASRMDTVLRLREMRSVEFDAEMDYGFAEPSYKVSVVCENEKDNCGYIIGKALNDGSGNYAKRDGEDYVFVIASADMAILSKPIEELSVSMAVSPVVKSDESDGAYFSGTELSTFDYIKISQKGGDTIRLEKNPDEITSAAIGSLMTEPSRRFADDELVDKLFKVAKEGLAAECAYKYHPAAADIKAYSLDNAQFSYEIKFGNETVSFAATPADLGFYAVLCSKNPDIIFKVKEENLSFAEYPKEQYASNSAFVERLSELEKISFTAEGKTRVAEITYYPEEKENDFSIRMDGRTIDAENFIAYYDYLLGIELNEVSFERFRGASPEFSIKVEYANKAGESELNFYKSSSRRYYVESNGTPLGYISSSYVDKLITLLSSVERDETIPKAF